MGWMQFKSWLKLTLPALGGFGLLIAAVIDSSFLPLPLVTDLLLMELSSLHPLRMPYYVATAALGSLVENSFNKIPWPRFFCLRWPLFHCRSSRLSSPREFFKCRS